MTISEKIFNRLNELGMTQKEFSEKTGIAQSSISDWKHKHTNPSADSLLIISKVLGLSVDDLLSGMETSDSKKKAAGGYYVYASDSEIGALIEKYQSLSDLDKGRLEGFLEALSEKI